MVEAFKKQCGINHVPSIRKDTNDVLKKIFVPQPSVETTELPTTFEETPPKDQDLKVLTSEARHVNSKDLYIRSPLDISNFIIALKFVYLIKFNCEKLRLYIKIAEFEYETENSEEENFENSNNFTLPYNDANQNSPENRRITARQ